MKTSTSWLLSTLLFILLMAGCHSAARKSRVAQEDDIREVILHHEMGAPPSAAQKNENAQRPMPTPTPNDNGSSRPTVCYLALDDNKDTRDGLLARFQNYTIPVKKVSECYIAPNDSGYWVRDKQTQELGLIYRVTDLKWVDENKVTATSGYYGGGLFATTNYYTVVWDGAQWKVRKIDYGPVA